MNKWSAGIDYDEGRIGKVAMFGLKSREDAVAWLERAFNWKRCWYMSPSMWIEEKKGN